MADGDLSRDEVERMRRLHYGGQADAMLAEQELLHRMWARYQQIEDRYHSAAGVRRGEPDIFYVMAELVEVVRAYDREQDAAAAPKIRQPREGEPPGLYLDREGTGGG